MNDAERLGRRVPDLEIPPVRAREPLGADEDRDARTVHEGQRGKVKHGFSLSAHQLVQAWRRRRFQPAARNTGVPASRPYDLRHAFASLLIHEGRLSPVEIAEQLGHSTQMLLNTYAHVLAEQKGARKTSAETLIRRARDHQQRQAQ